MAKRRGHKALYEVLGNSKLKTSYQKTLEQVQKTEQKPPPPPESPEIEPEQQVSTGWPKKPKIMQFNDSSLDLSLPYPLAITALIAVVLLLLICFRLGQIIALRSQDAPSQTDTMQNAAAGRLPQPIEQPVTTTVAKPPIPAGSTVSTGNNRIVIQQYHNRANLEPAKTYFAQFGIETEILNINNTYFLVTKTKYENPNRKGTDGYNARQRIIKLGANYVAPEGYESFGQKPFHDAYGRRFDE